MFVFDKRFLKYLNYLSKLPKERSPSVSCREFLNQQMLGIDTEEKDKKWVLRYFKQALQGEEKKLYGKLIDDHNVPHEVLPLLNMYLSTCYISYKKLEMNHDTVRDPSSHRTKKDKVSQKKHDKKDKYTYACYDLLQSIYAFDERFLKFLNHLSKQPKEKTFQDSCSIFLNYKMLGIDTEGKDKKWVLQYFERALEGSEQNLYGKLKDDGKIPHEVEEELIMYLSNLYTPYKKLEMKHDATATQIMPLSFIPPETGATLKDQNMQQG